MKEQRRPKTGTEFTRAENGNLKEERVEKRKRRRSEHARSLLCWKRAKTHNLLPVSLCLDAHVSGHVKRGRR